MAFTCTYNQTVNIDGRTYNDLGFTYTEDGLISRDPVIATGVTDQLVDLVLTRADASFIYFFSDQDVTLEFNDGAGAGGTISLGADFPWIWYTDKEDLTLTDVITADITPGIYISNASGQTANIRIRILFDSTPA